MKIKFTVSVLVAIFTTISLMATTQNEVKADIFGDDLYNGFKDDTSVDGFRDDTPENPLPDNPIIPHIEDEGKAKNLLPDNTTNPVGKSTNTQESLLPDNPVGKSTIQAQFTCVSQGNGYATVVRKAEGETVLITWNSRSFGPRYTPQERCNQVTGRLQNYVSANGNNISNLLLTTGYVNGLPVICVVNNGQSGCNSNNVLLTLSQQNAANPSQALTQFLNLTQGNISGNPIQERQGKSIVPLDIAVDSSFSSPRSILESGRLKIVNCSDARSSLIIFDNSKLCVQAKGPLKARKRYYYNSSTGKINKQRI